MKIANEMNCGFATWYLITALIHFLTANTYFIRGLYAYMHTVGSLSALRQYAIVLPVQRHLLPLS